jgi:hypothetical protein
MRKTAGRRRIGYAETLANILEYPKETVLISSNNITTMYEPINTICILSHRACSEPNLTCFTGISDTPFNNHVVEIFYLFA